MNTLISDSPNLKIADLKSSAAPVIFRELAAARYLGVCRSTFRRIVDAGLIPWSRHAVGKTRIYRRSDLDVYLDSLKWRKMEARENLPAPKQRSK